MSDVKLFKKKGTYVDKKDGQEKNYTNFYVRCGDDLVPVQVCYFENAEGRDPQYSARRAVLSAFAETLPEKAAKPVAREDAAAKAQPQSAKHKSANSEDDESVPF